VTMLSIAWLEERTVCSKSDKIDTVSVDIEDDTVQTTISSIEWPKENYIS